MNPSRSIRLSLAAMMLSGIGTAALAAPLTLSGLIANPASYSIADLQALGDETIVVAAGTGAGTYRGVPLWTLLGGEANGASDVQTVGGGNNPILRNYLVATGAGDSRSIISLGEINPLFGGSGAPYLVSYEKDGVLLDTPQLIVPLDNVGTRDVFDLTGLTVKAVPRPPSGPRAPSTEFVLSGPGFAPQTFDLASLQALPATTEDVSFFSGPNPQNRTYTGTSLWDFLTAAGLTGDLDNLLLATGSDGFQVAFSIAELSPQLGAPGLPGPIDLIVYGETVNGADGPLASGDGFARLAMPGDVRGGRYVSNLASLRVLDLPEPAAALLLLPGAVLLLAIRRRRQVAG